MGVNRQILNILRGPLRINPVTRDLVGSPWHTSARL
jgi:hypothetical protein